MTNISKLDWINALFVFLTTFFVYLFIANGFGWLSTPPARGDQPDYDAIAFQIWQGKGFSYDWDNPAYLEPYLINQQNHDYDYIFQRSGTYLTAYRPPLFPVLIAFTYAIFGRVFLPIRIVNILCMALTNAIYFLLLSRKFGKLAAILFAFLFIFNIQIIHESSQLMTESLAVVIVAILIWFLFRYVDSYSGSWFDVVNLGVITGLAVLNRSIFVFWTPFIVILIFWFRPSKKGFYHLAVFGLSTLVIILPWAVRNCVVLNSFMPFGTQGGINLPAGYSDQALKNKGVWFNPDNSGFYDAINQTTTGLQQEKAKSIYGQAISIKWTKQNWDKLPILVYYKILDLWTPGSQSNLLIFLFAFFGLLFSNWKSEMPIFLFIVIANTAGVAFTYSAGNRFLFPIMPLLYLLASIALARFGYLLFNRLKVLNNK